MGAIAAGVQACRNRIESACKTAQRAPESVLLLAVSKTFSASAIREANAAGQTAFGESYLQEALLKQSELSDLALDWHFIGPIQSNKTRSIAEHFSWVHSLDRLKIAQRLSEARSTHASALNVCIEVNVSGEDSKHGATIEQAMHLAHEVSCLPNLRLRGFMTIPQASADPVAQRAQFHRLKALFDAARQSGLDVDTLSMGMSDDLESAIMEGATIVRVGTAIFGYRDYSNNKVKA